MHILLSCINIFIEFIAQLFTNNKYISYIEQAIQSELLKTGHLNNTHSFGAKKKCLKQKLFGIERDNISSYDSDHSPGGDA